MASFIDFENTFNCLNISDIEKKPKSKELNIDELENFNIDI